MPPTKVEVEKAVGGTCRRAEGYRGLLIEPALPLRFIYETEHHNGIAELLEILGR